MARHACHNTSSRHAWSNLIEFILPWTRHHEALVQSPCSGVGYEAVIRWTRWPTPATDDRRRAAAHGRSCWSSPSPDRRHHPRRTCSSSRANTDPCDRSTGAMRGASRSRCRRSDYWDSAGPGGSSGTICPRPSESTWTPRPFPETVALIDNIDTTIINLSTVFVCAYIGAFVRACNQWTSLRLRAYDRPDLGIDTNNWNYSTHLHRDVSSLFNLVSSNLVKDLFALATTVNFASCKVTKNINLSLPMILVPFYLYCYVVALTRRSLHKCVFCFHGSLVSDQYIDILIFVNAMQETQTKVSPGATNVWHIPQTKVKHLDQSPQQLLCFSFLHTCLSQCRFNFFATLRVPEHLPGVTNDALLRPIYTRIIYWKK